MSFDVCCTVRASRFMVSAFIHHYRMLGARRIHLFHDDPEHAHLFEGEDLVQHVCDDAYWQGARPKHLEQRQIANATSAYRDSDADWLLHCDIDEFLISQTPLNPLLDSLPDSAETILVRPCEAIYDELPRDEVEMLSTTLFRPLVSWGLGKAFLQQLYPHFDVELYTAGGFSAHRRGKSLTRTAIRDRIRRIPLHEHRDKGKDRGSYIPQQHDLPQLELRHYDCQPVDIWLARHLARINGKVSVPMMGDKRRAIAEEASLRWRIKGRNGLIDLMSMLYRVPPDRIEEGIAAGVVQRAPPLDLPAA